MTKKIPSDKIGHLQFVLISEIASKATLNQLDIRPFLQQLRLHARLHYEVQLLSNNQIALDKHTAFHMETKRQWH